MHAGFIGPQQKQKHGLSHAIQLDLPDFGKAGQTLKDAIVASLAHRSRRKLRICLQIAVVQSELTLEQGGKKVHVSGPLQ